MSTIPQDLDFQGRIYNDTSHTDHSDTEDDSEPYLLATLCTCTRAKSQTLGSLRMLLVQNGMCCVR